MESLLTVGLMLNANCELIATDSSQYEEFEDVSKHAIIEFLSNYDSKIIMQRLHMIEGMEDPELTTSKPISLPADGTYTYYRLVIPTLDHYLIDGGYQVENKFFAYNNKVYFSNHSFSTFVESQVDLIEDYTLVWDAKDTDNQMFWFNDRLFSICKLNSCLINLLKADIAKTVKEGCNTGCSTSSENRLDIDFLLESSFALRYLVELGRFEDAQRVLNTISSCGSICKSALADDDSDCGCGKD